MVRKIFQLRTDFTCELKYAARVKQKFSNLVLKQKVCPLLPYVIISMSLC